MTKIAGKAPVKTSPIEAVQSVIKVAVVEAFIGYFFMVNKSASTTIPNTNPYDIIQIPNLKISNSVISK